MPRALLICGFHAVTAKLRHHPKSLKLIYLSGERVDARARQLVQLADAQGVKLARVSSARLNAMLPGARHQGVVASVSGNSRRTSLDELLDALTDPPFLLVLDGVTDPRNLGACLRVADAAGVHAVVVPKDRSAGLAESALKAASGAAESTPLCRVTNLARTLRGLKLRDIHIIGTADEAARNLYKASWPDAAGCAWVLGAEDKGLRRLTRECCDQLLEIPMHGQVSSLNVAVAAGVCLYEARRRMRCE